MITITDALSRALARRSSELRIAQVAGDSAVVDATEAGVPGPTQSNALQARHLVEIRARRRNRPRLEKVERFWDGLGEIDATIIAPRDGSQQTRAFTGVGALLSVPVIPRTLGLTVNRITISLSQLDEDVLTVLQKQDARGARVTIWRAFFEPGTSAQVGEAPILFRGFASDFSVKTPAEGELGSADLQCEPDLAGLTRAGNEMRAAGSQRERNPDDAFYDDVGTMGVLRIVWGTHDGPVEKGGGRSSSERAPQIQFWDKDAGR